MLCKAKDKTKSAATVKLDRVGVQEPEIAPESRLAKPGKKGAAFWFVILGINLASFLALLEATIISNALPTIVNDLHGVDFVWAGAAYNLAAASFMPLTGVLAQILGRKSILIGTLVIFSVGCAICGAAHSINMLIGGRVVQGVGGAGILSSSAIIISDIVPLAERGLFNGLLQLTWCLASGIGPIIGGSLAEEGQWRWIFFLNLPIAPVAGLLIIFFLQLKVPKCSLQESIKQLDWIGNLLLISGTCSVGIGLVWGGVTFPWSSGHIIAPICIGGVALFVAVLYEYKWAPVPLIPIKFMSNRTILSGYLQTMIYPLPFLALVYYLPIYFQACKGVTPIRSGVLLFGIAFSTPPFAIISGILVTIFKIYRVQLWMGWIISIVGLALLGTTHANTPTAVMVGYEIITGAGFGIIFSTTYFPVLAPLPVTSVAKALAFYAFLRQFTQVWGIVVGGAILQNELSKTLPESFLSKFPLNGEAISIIPRIATLPPQDLALVREAFAVSLARLWQIMAGITGVGLLVALLMKHYSLHTSVDKDWGIKEEDNQVAKLHKNRSNF